LLICCLNERQSSCGNCNSIGEIRPQRLIPVF
jgi:hypothetical protein